MPQSQHEHSLFACRRQRRQGGGQQTFTGTWQQTTFGTQRVTVWHTFFGTHFVTRIVLV